MDDKNIKIENPEQALNYLGQIISVDDYKNLNPSIKSVIFDKARQNSKYKEYTDKQFEELVDKSGLDSLRDILQDAILERISSTLPQNKEEQEKTLKEKKQTQQQADAAAKKSVEQTVEQAKAQKKAADTAKESQTKKIEPVVTKSLFANPITTPKPVMVEAKLETKINEVKSDPEFTNKFVEYFSKPENAPEGVDTKTAQLVAVSIAADLVINKAPLVKVDNGQTIPLPNPLLAQIAILNDKEVLQKNLGTESNEAFELVAKATAHDAVWYMAGRDMVDKYFETPDSKAASTILLGDQNQEYEISDTPTDTNSLDIDLSQVITHAQQVNEIFNQTPQQAFFSIKNSFSDVSFKPDIGEFARNIEKVTRGIMETFSGPASAGEFVGPSIGQVQAMQYLKLMPQMSPELTSIMFDQIQLAKFTFGKLPFAPGGAEVVIKGGLFKGLGFSAKRLGIEGLKVAAKTGAAEVVAAGTAAAATTTAGATAGGGLLALLGGPVGIVASIGIFIATNFSKIKVWFLRNKGKIGNILLGFGILPLIAGFLTGSVPLMLGGGILTGAGVLGGGTVAGAAAAGWAIGSSIFTGAILPGIAGPLIGSLIGFPLVVALILFIINSSAYVIPPGTGVGGLETGPVSGQVDVYGSCPLTGEYFISTSSLNGGIGHGSELYWTVCSGTPLVCGVTPPKERYSIPIWGQFPKNPQYPAGCVDTTCPYYGFAADVAATSGNTSPQVIAPKICGTGTTCEDLSWKVLSIIPHPFGWGTGAILYATGNGHSYQIYLAHMDSVTVASSPALHGGEIPSGTVLAPLSSALTHPHVHIELNVDGAPVKPDFLCP